MCSLYLEKCLQNSKNALTDFSPFKMAFLQCKYSSNAAYFGLWHFLPPCLNHCVRHCQGQCQRQCLRKHRQPMIIWRWRTLVCFLLQERTCQASFTGPGRRGAWPRPWLGGTLSFVLPSFVLPSFVLPSFVLPIICPTNHFSFC